ncbi:MAG: MotA/TolQ/ExbB proton channel family protein [Verrucomicrobiota bacterium]|jgi:biopolymer transport protein ExbB|nr:MotA/TolQ/ExbB proton channel family protein [Verrucomicrobiota bacterium]
MNRLRQFFAYVVIAWTLLGPLGLVVQAAPQPVAEAGQEQAKKKDKLSLWQLLGKGGYIMIPLAICSVVGLASSFERSISLSRSRVMPEGLLDDVKKKLGSGGNTKAAIAFCEESASAAGRLIKAGLGKMRRGEEQVEKALEEAGAQEIDRMKRSLQILGLVIAIAPLLGLVGTVYGMIEAFQSTYASTAATGKAEQLASGIYEALVTTATGLTIAIPIMVVFYLLNKKVESYLDDFTQLGEEFLVISDKKPPTDTRNSPKRTEAKKPRASEPVASE